MLNCSCFSVNQESHPFTYLIGRAVISLSVDLGHVLSEPGLLHHRPRNGPSRQRRRERRTAAREQQVAAEEAELDAVKALGEPSEAVKST